MRPALSLWQLLQVEKKRGAGGGGKWELGFAICVSLIKSCERWDEQVFIFARTVSSFVAVPAPTRQFGTRAQTACAMESESTLALISEGVAVFSFASSHIGMSALR